MKSYELIKIKLGVFGGASEKSTGKLTVEEAIRKYASQGYRYVGYVPEEVGAYGNFSAINLIFEKDE